MADRGERLDRLAEPHLVADDRSPLRQGESSPERLVAAKRNVEEGRVERVFGDSVNQLLGEAAVNLLLIGAEAAHGDEQAIEGNRVVRVLVPDPADSGRLDRENGFRDLREFGRSIGAHERIEFFERGLGRVATLAPGEKQPHGAARRCGSL